MNARTAVIENQILVNDLIVSAKKFAELKKITVKEALDFKVNFYVKYSKNGTEATAWVSRGKKASFLIN